MLADSYDMLNCEILKSYCYQNIRKNRNSLGLVSPNNVKQFLLTLLTALSTRVCHSLGKSVRGALYRCVHLVVRITFH